MVCPHDWNGLVKGCAGYKQLLWGGVRKVWRRRNPEKPDERSQEFELLPQQAFVPPGTVYVFWEALPEPMPHAMLSMKNITLKIGLARTSLGTVDDVQIVKKWLEQTLLTEV